MPPIDFRFRLYVAGDAPNSRLAVANLQRLCREHLGDRAPVEIVDVLRAPERALTDGILLTPTLLGDDGAKTRRIVGNLNDLDRVRQLLGLSP